MIKQRYVTTKTATAALTYAELGDVICNSTNAQTYTLPTGIKGLWYKIHNVNTGAVYISDGSNVLTFVNQHESVEAVYDDTNSVWRYSKGGDKEFEDCVTITKSGAISEYDTNKLLLCSAANDIALTLPEISEGLVYKIKNLTTGKTVSVQGHAIGSGIDSYVKSMLHFNGTDTSQVFTDEVGVSWTANGTAQLDTAQKKFGTASGLFDGDSDYISTPDSDDWNFGSGNFTIDFWIRFTARAAYHTICAQQDDGDNRYHFALNGDGSQFQVFVKAGGVVLAEYVTTNANLSNATWYHIAFVRSGSNIYIFKNGVALTLSISTAIGTNSLPNLTTGVFSIGARKDPAGAADRFVNGWIDEMRISKGEARWTTTFTPPTSEYTLETYDSIDNSVSAISLAYLDAVKLVCDATEWWVVADYSATLKADVAASKVVTDLIDITQAVDLDTMESDIASAKAKTDQISVTQPVDLDTMESDIADAKGKTDNITITQAVNLDTVESDVTAAKASLVYSMTSGGSANTYTGTFSGLTYYAGLKINLTIHAVNTGASTFNLNALGAKTVYKVIADGTKTALTAGNLAGIAQLEYDGTDVILLNWR